MTNRAQPPDWFLVRRLVRLVGKAAGGGLHRTELAEQAGVPAYSPEFSHALLVAYGRKQLDFCGQYVVKPVRPRQMHAEREE